MTSKKKKPVAVFPSAGFLLRPSRHPAGSWCRRPDFFRNVSASASARRRRLHRHRRRQVRQKTARLLAFLTVRAKKNKDEMLMNPAILLVEIRQKR
jgi:hypothetical protein